MGIEKVNPVITFLKDGTFEGTYCTTTTNEEEDFIIKSIAENRKRKSLMGVSDADIIKERANYFNDTNIRPFVSHSKPKKELTHLYLIVNTSSNSLKIGKTKSLADRLSQLNTASSDRLEYKDTKQFLGHLEKTIHEKFSHLRRNGEWFEYSEEIINYFKGL